MKTKILIIVLVLIALVLGIMIYQGGVSVSPQPSGLQPTSVLPPTSVSPQTGGAKAPQPPSDFAQENILLSDVSGGSAFGGANRYAKDGRFYIGILVQKLPDPPAGQFYEGWLSQAGKEGDGLPLGTMIKEEKGDFAGSYALGYAVAQNLRQYTKVLVTLQTVKDGKPEKVILTGTFSK